MSGFTYPADDDGPRLCRKDGNPTEVILRDTRAYIAPDVSRKSGTTLNNSPLFCDLFEDTMSYSAKIWPDIKIFTYRSEILDDDELGQLGLLREKLFGGATVETEHILASVEGLVLSTVGKLDKRLKNKAKSLKDKARMKAKKAEEKARMAADPMGIVEVVKHEANGKGEKGE